MAQEEGFTEAAAHLVHSSQEAKLKNDKTIKALSFTCSRLRAKIARSV